MKRPVLTPAERDARDAAAVREREARGWYERPITDAERRSVRPVPLPDVRDEPCAECGAERSAYLLVGARGRCSRCYDDALVRIARRAYARKTWGVEL